MKLLRLKKEDTGDRRSGAEGSAWLTPPLGGIYSSLKEIGLYIELRNTNQYSCFATLLKPRRIHTTKREDTSGAGS